MTHPADTAFIDYLQQLQGRDRGAMATLRHSLTFAPGDYPKAYPYVERFVGNDWHAQDARRLARYAVAGLFAMHPLRQNRSLATAWGHLFADKKRPSLEMRFIALLEADADSVMAHLRQAVGLLAAESLGFDPVALQADLCVALNHSAAPEQRDRLKRRWARDFYRAVQLAEPAPDTPASIPVTTHD